MNEHFLKLPRIAASVGVLLCGLSLAGTYARQAGELKPLDVREPVTYFIADGSGGSGYRPSDQQLAKWALDAWQRTIGPSLRFQSAAETNALVRIYWADPEDGQFGETRPVTIGGRHGAAVFIRPDVDALGEDLAQRARVDDLLRDSVVYLTCVHELGHALGLEHTSDFRDIMYFFGYGGDINEYFGRYRTQIHSRSDIAAASGLSAADVRHIRALYPHE